MRGRREELVVSGLERMPARHADHLGGSSRPPDRKPVVLRQRPQLLQREPTPPPRMRYQQARPHALRSRRLTGFLSTPPPPGARAAQLLGTFVGDGRPSIWIARAHKVLHPSSPFFRDDNMTVLYERYGHIVERAESARISHRCMNEGR